MCNKNREFIASLYIKNILLKSLQVENKRLREALEWWIEVNKGAPNKYEWAKQALDGVKE